MRVYILRIKEKNDSNLGISATLDKIRSASQYFKHLI